MTMRGLAGESAAALQESEFADDPVPVKRHVVELGPEGKPRSVRIIDDVNWRRTNRMLNLGVFALLLITLAISLVNASSHQHRLIVGLATALLGWGYWIFGSPAIEQPHPARARAFLLILASTSALIIYFGGGFVMAPMILGFTLVWFLSQGPEAVLWLVLIGLAIYSAIWGRMGFDPSRLGNLAVDLFVTTIFSTGMGFFVHHSIVVGDRNAKYAEDLQNAQARIAASEHTAGVLAERERVAREIHDTLAQGFTSVVMQAGAAKRALGRGETEAVANRLEMMESIARENLAEARALVAASGPAPLQEQALTEAIRRMGGEFASRNNINVTFRFDAEAETAAKVLEQTKSVVLYRAVQESLENVRKHSGASSVIVVLQNEAMADGGQILRLSVINDGDPIPPGTPEGFGLRGLRERVAAVGGQVQITSTTQGVTLVVEVPVSDASY